MNSINQPYVKQYNEEGELVNPIPAEGYLTNNPYLTRKARRMRFTRTINNRKGRNRYQVKMKPIYHTIINEKGEEVREILYSVPTKSFIVHRLIPIFKKFDGKFD